ncbi:hypothetical protein [Actinocrinis sp.]|uniref:hypothetical protein n=1 Tax=Actinocrinis sp. TaxID=1920516 RepID=UPI002DDD70AF|nr:hypothetical protein [Actinocrinis sp.]
MVDDPHLPYAWVPAHAPPDAALLERVLAGLERLHRLAEAHPTGRPRRSQSGELPNRRPASP